jgi:hypothetical protein
LASCNGNISETNISAMLVYLLDPSNDHGLGDKFLKKIIGKLKNEELKNNKKLQSYLDNSSGYEVDIEYEFPVNVEETESINSIRKIDIVIEFYNEESKDIPEFAIAIENKIQSTSANDKNQFKDEIVGLKSSYKDDYKTDIDVYFILICPENKKIEKMFSEIADNKVRILWKNQKDDKKTDKSSISDIFKDILRDECEAKIDPLSTEVIYILKSFVAFIDNDFKSEDINEKGERNKYGKPVVEYLADIRDTLDANTEYDVQDIKDELFKIVKEKSGQPLTNQTRNDQFYKVTVNAPSRASLYISKPLDDRYSLFYYSDSDKTKIKRFDYEKSPENIDIYWDAKGETIPKTLLELRKMKEAGEID